MWVCERAGVCFGCVCLGVSVYMRVCARTSFAQPSCPACTQPHDLHTCHHMARTPALHSAYLGVINSHAATQPRSHSAMQPLSHAATQPLSHSAMQPLSHAAAAQQQVKWRPCPAPFIPVLPQSLQLQTQPGMARTQTHLRKCTRTHMSKHTQTHHEETHTSDCNISGTSVHSHARTHWHVPVRAWRHKPWGNI